MYDLTLGFVNCNRLHYLRATVESAIETTQNDKVQIIVVDNASVEEGTDQYLMDLLRRGIEVYATKERDPNNEYARALNLIVQKADSELIAPCPGDIQFIRHNWVKEYIFANNEDDGASCMALDAQRRSRIEKKKYSQSWSEIYNDFFALDYEDPFCAAGCVVYERFSLHSSLPWSVDNGHHEGGDDSETKMLKKMRETHHHHYEGDPWKAVPRVPPAVAIYDEYGSNAIVRGDKRYGNYAAPKEGIYYYKILDKIPDFDSIASIEDVAIPTSNPQPLDESGNWIKAPTNRSIVESL